MSLAFVTPVGQATATPALVSSTATHPVTSFPQTYSSTSERGGQSSGSALSLTTTIGAVAGIISLCTTRRRSGSGRKCTRRGIVATRARGGEVDDAAVRGFKALHPWEQFQRPTELRKGGRGWMVGLFQAEAFYNSMTLEKFEAAKADPDTEVLEALLTYETDEGRTTLMKACMNEDVALVKALIEAGADVNAASEEGEQVLNWAMLSAPHPLKPEEPQEQIVKMLVEAGAELGPGYGCYPERVAQYRPAGVGA